MIQRVGWLVFQSKIDINVLKPHAELLSEQLLVAAHKGIVNVRRFSFLTTQIPLSACSLEQISESLFWVSKYSHLMANHLL